MNGETETGGTLHRLVKRADAGAIVAQLRVAIAPDDIAITLHHKLCHAARQLLEQTLPAIKHGNILEIAQRENEATCFGRRTPDDSFLEWHKPASVLHNMVRAVADPWPGAFSYVGNQKFTVWSSRVHPHASKAQPGSVISVAPLLIACGDGALEIVTGQAGDGITMQGSQLAQTLGLVQGSRLNSQPDGAARRRTRVLILGVNGFIGNHLTERLLREDHYEVYGLDIGSDARRCDDQRTCKAKISFHQWNSFIYSLISMLCTPPRPQSRHSLPTLSSTYFPQLYPASSRLDTMPAAQ